MSNAVLNRAGGILVASGVTAALAAAPAEAAFYPKLSDKKSGGVCSAQATLVVYSSTPDVDNTGNSYITAGSLTCPGPGYQFKMRFTNGGNPVYTADIPVAFDYSSNKYRVTRTFTDSSRGFHQNCVEAWQGLTKVDGICTDSLK